MQTDSLLISFGEVSVAEGNRLAGTLAEMLRDADPNVTVERHRQLPQAQDFGATLVVVLGTAAASALAKGVAAWLTRNSGAKLEIRRNGETLLVIHQNIVHPQYQ